MNILRSTIIAAQAVLICVLLFWIGARHEEQCGAENALIAQLMAAAEEQKKAAAEAEHDDEPVPCAVSDEYLSFQDQNWKKRATYCEYSRWLQNGDQPRGIAGNRRQAER